MTFADQPPSHRKTGGKTVNRTCLHTCAVVPAMIAGLFGVTVVTTGAHNSAAASVAPNAGIHSSMVAPSISSLTPTSGPGTGGTLVTINGADFPDVTGVSFGGTPGTGINVISTTQLRVQSPPHAPGTVDVTVTTAGGVTEAVSFTISRCRC